MLKIRGISPRNMTLKAMPFWIPSTCEINIKYDPESCVQFLYLYWLDYPQVTIIHNRFFIFVNYHNLKLDFASIYICTIIIYISSIMVLVQAQRQKTKRQTELVAVDLCLIFFFFQTVQSCSNTCPSRFWIWF